jgi:2,3-bisphosphoglycerate-dependent phosphoglycerate mutase
LDPRYANIDSTQLPSTESLKDTLARVMPLWESRISSDLLAGRNLLIAAHGNSLRALVKMLDNISDHDIVEVNIPTGVPLLYELDANLRPVRKGYLGDPAAIAAATEVVRKQAEKR